MKTIEMGAKHLKRNMDRYRLDFIDSLIGYFSFTQLLLKIFFKKKKKIQKVI